MDQNLQNPNNGQSEPPPRRSWLTETAVGTALGATIGLIFSVFNKKATRGKQVGIGALAGAVVSFLANRFSKPEAPTPEAGTPSFTPPTPPSEPERPAGLALGTVPQVLDILVAQGQLTAEQQAKLLQDIKTGRQGFAGAMAVADGFIGQPQLDAALAMQGAHKAEAALVDIQNISQFGPLAAPAYLKANWGNSGVNPAAANPSRVDGIAAAANAAQNLVMLANANPNPALMPVIQEGVLAAANLARGIAQGNSAVVPLAKMAPVWQQSLNQALVLAAEANPALVTDAQGQPVDVHTFVAARNAELTAAIQQTLAQDQQRGQTPGL